MEASSIIFGIVFCGGGGGGARLVPIHYAGSQKIHEMPFQHVEFKDT